MNISFSRDTLNAQLAAKINGCPQVLHLYPDSVYLIDSTGKIIEVDSEHSEKLYHWIQLSIYCQNAKTLEEIYNCLSTFFDKIKL